MKSRLGPILFAAALAALAFFIFRGRGAEGLLGGRASSGPQRGDPDETVFAMVQAAQNGDTKAYLECFWGPLRTRLEQTERELGTRGFGKYLQESAGVIVGVAILGEPEPVGEDMKVQAEMQFEDKKEAQQFILTRRRGRWRISGMEGPQRLRTVIPYGAEAYPLLPPIRGEGEEPTQ